MAKLDDQITLLQERLAQMKVRQQRIEARKRAIEAQRERKVDLRRRILVGTLVMDKVRDGGFDPSILRGWLDSSLTRSSDRALFDLPPLEGSATGSR